MIQRCFELTESGALAKAVGRCVWIDVEDYADKALKGGLASGNGHRS